MRKAEVNQDLVTLTARIVSAYVQNNTLDQNEISGIINTVHDSLNRLSGKAEPPQPAQKPAVPIKNSVTPDYIICLEDGKKFKIMKRHLTTVYGMTPAEYRKKWNLPPDYPMVAPNYARSRSQYARERQKQAVNLQSLRKGGRKRARAAGDGAPGAGHVPVIIRPD
ncbi:MucR family transcriptional regulator [Camelimonas abortus]